MALGADRGPVVRLVARKEEVVVGIGMMVGVPAALAPTRFVKSFLFGVTAQDPLIVVGVGIVLATVAGLACLVPAPRATKVDPTVALR